MEESNIIENGVVQTCSICQQPLTAFGSKKLADGILCRDCAKKLSEWLSDEDISNMKVSKIRKHLNYREKNQSNLQSFNPTKKYEAKYDLYIDETKGSFVISKKKDFIKENADVIKLWKIKSIRSYEQRNELSEGYDILIDINLMFSPFKKMTFRVNEFTGLLKDTEQFNTTKETAENYLKLFIDARVNAGKIRREYGN